MNRTMISIVIPTLNEAENIAVLVKRIKSSLHKAGIKYEIIFIDDNSTDSTVDEICKFTNTHPVKVFQKQGIKGKAQSLIEGFTHASYEVVAMIDADLQYPPEAIPEMFSKIANDKADIVIANRVKHETNFLRKLTSSTFKTIFGKMMHGLDCDVQSGLKLFRKEITERISVSSTGWSFDLEFLTKAKQANYSVDSVDITFSERLHGEAKVSLLRTSLDVGMNALKIKLQAHAIIPFSKAQEKKLGKGFDYKNRRYVTHSNLDVAETALRRFSTTQFIVILLIMTMVVASLIVAPIFSLQMILAGLTLFYLIDLVFNSFLVYRSLNDSPEIVINNLEIETFENNWPKYTIFCPLYKEAHIIPQFTEAMSKLDYPHDKLEVMLLLEEDDQETVKAAQKMNLPGYFKIVVVPDAQPKTKPKACNYGLLKATGEYAVIYDAEDIPDPDQLKKVVVAFNKLGKEYACIQGKLNYYNPNQNILTRLFTLEYSLWFGLTLPGLQSVNAPIPLGGTSNHFRTNDLRSFDGWDPFNVTEDADLGMRIVKRGFLTAVIDSYTMEEANSQFWNWIRQRSRWIKGYMQTYLVHMRKPGKMMTNWKRPHLLTFQLTVGGKILSMLVNPLLWITTVSYFVFRETMEPILDTLLLPWVYYFGMISLVFGNFFYFYNYMIAAAQQKRWNLVKFGYLVPFYWLMMSAAAIFALYELIVKPHHWQKTLHGLHLKKDSETKESKSSGFLADTKLGILFNRNN